MKISKLYLSNFLPILFVFILSPATYSQEITRGPDIGEIYFMGPTATVLYDAIYRSTDFGETAVCVDSISALSNTIASISADKTSGGLYYTTMGEGLYYSDNYGNFGSWQLHYGGISYKISSGRNEGEIYNRIGSHSIDYGLSFTTHSCQGFFGSTKAVEIDVSIDTAYCISYHYDVNDTLYFFISYNNYNYLEVIKRFNFMAGENVQLSRENNPGNVFLYNENRKNLYWSDDYGFNWNLKNKFSCPNLPIEWITGGRQDGELYMLVVYLQMMGQRRHIYLYHSLDYGETFTIYHPVAIGPEPVYANFIAEDTLVEPGDTVQFTDLSNDAETWQWDFNFDGDIDSYDQNPTYIYQDTGYHTVILSITGAAIQDFGIRYDYIHVSNLTNLSEFNFKNESICYPNPFSDKTTIRFDRPENCTNSLLNIYNATGSIVRRLIIEEKKSQIWDGRDDNGYLLPNGVYFYNLEIDGKLTGSGKMVKIQ